jgi:hypothetical protein
MKVLKFKTASVLICVRVKVSISFPEPAVLGKEPTAGSGNEIGSRSTLDYIKRAQVIAPWLNVQNLVDLQPCLRLQIFFTLN